MKLETVQAFLKAIGVQQTSTKGTWVQSSCPLAPFLHKGGKDNNPSFAINSATAAFNCYTCKSGSLPLLLQTIEHHVKDQPVYLPKYHFKLARQILKEVGDELEPLPPFESIPAAAAPFQPWPEDWLEKFIPVAQAERAIWYLTHYRVEKGNQPVDLAIAAKLELRYDAAYDRIVCPYRYFNGKLAGARGRTIDPDAKMQHWDYTWEGINNAHCVWYNEPALEAAALAKAPVVVCEGQFDVMNVLRVYPYVVGNLTAKATIEKMVKLQSTYGVLLMLDNDIAGYGARDRYVEHLDGKVPLSIVAYDDQFKDPAQLPLSELASLKEIQ
jgi:5S rRNA maturation endonuclease (ribonuclease M5)